METKHTPGPWRRHSVEAYIVVSNDGTAVADTEADSVQHHQRLCNARLIAAAPDLLEALKGIVDDDDAGVSLADQLARSGARMAAAKAAILKATGA